MKTYRQHRCQHRHRSYRTLANCIWPRAAWVRGDGPYAVICGCHARPTISLHATVDAAENALLRLDSFTCGGICTGAHELARIDLSVTTDDARSTERLEALHAARLPYRDDD